MRTYLDVTREHIEKGVPNDANSCAVALALRDEFPGAGYVSVETFRRVDDPSDSWSELLVTLPIADAEPDEAEEIELSGGMDDDGLAFALAFDAGEPVSPLTFLVILHQA